MPILGIYSSAQQASNLPTSFESIASASGTGSSGTITLSSIPSTYTHLQLRIYASVSSSSQVLFMSVNGVGGTSYSYHSLAGDGATASSPSNATSNSQVRVFGTNTASNSSYPFVSIVDILDYANTNKNKTFRTLCGGDYNGSGDIALYSGAFYNTSAISSITLNMSSGNFNTATKIALYGVKN